MGNKLIKITTEEYNDIRDMLKKDFISSGCAKGLFYKTPGDLDGKKELKKWGI